MMRKVTAQPIMDSSLSSVAFASHFQSSDLLLA